ncbi:procollagen lysine,2 oxoglutarate 5 dioxygenase [Trichuris trichiura]|uniref:Procollagen lysine,2 oxoglutarate 5 dioxygenase n=1 Tax=Trichuris trichiura TaxID=36087 RepID=A0A077YYY5_TRITR|nr:procollagen lysine,2 oxoglutarate 5 dioxygenase [Trichuris trichiura]
MERAGSAFVAATRLPGGKVIWAARDTAKAQRKLNDLAWTAHHGKRGYIIKLDLASKNKIDQFVDEFKKREKNLHCLILNAAYWGPRRLTEDGFEETFGVNHLGHMYLVYKLLDVLKASAPSRVIVVGSDIHRLYSGVNFDDLMMEENYGAWRAYGHSKLCTILFGRELAKRLEGSGITVSIAHPGTPVPSELMRNSWAFWSLFHMFVLQPVFHLFCRTTMQGAQTTVYCACSEECGKVTGNYYELVARARLYAQYLTLTLFLRNAKKDCPNAAARDDAAAKRLWDISCEMQSDSPLLRVYRAMYYLAAVLLALSFVVDAERLLVLTVATERTDGFLRTERSLLQFSLNYHVLGLGTKWNGGDVRRTIGGGQKIRLLRDYLAQYKHDQDLVVLFIDGMRNLVSYDVVVNGDEKLILERFLQSGAKVLFSAEQYCWPDKSLAVSYPVIKRGKRYLNSGAFIGYASYVNKLLSEGQVKDDDDDQLFYTRVFLNDKLREKYEIKLDSTAELFQNLNGAVDDVDFDVSPDPRSDPRRGVRLDNLAYSSEPLVVHGNGPSKIHLNKLGNYLGNWWNPSAGCVACQEDQLSLDEDEEKWPFVVLASFITKPSPFVDLYFENLLSLSYPKSRMGIYLYNGVENYTRLVADFRREASKSFAFVESPSITSGDERFSFVKISTGSAADERQARDNAVQWCQERNCDYLLVWDANARLERPDTLQLLIKRNKPVVAPLLRTEGRLWSNFWGAISDNGFYQRSDDYVAIVEGQRVGIWNVPYVTMLYLVRKERLSKMVNPYSYNLKADPDMSFCQYCRDKDYFMYVDNTVEYGRSLDDYGYDSANSSSDLANLLSNKKEWERKYLHKDYGKVLEDDYVLALPCPDVYSFPIFSPAFCKDLIDTMEAYGKWSSGSHEDARLLGGYENVPTRDIHMNQVGLEAVWLKILDDYVRPVQEKAFTGYYSRPPKALMNFVVRYKPEEQASLRPHHDASTYTVDIALNRAGIDYEGGGVRYVRYNCTAKDLELGWALMHPGRLTHMHEGLQTTSGTRYIMVSFVDP